MSSFLFLFSLKEKEKEETIDGWIPGPTVLKENECGPRVSYPSSLSFSSFSFKRKERKRGRETWRFRKKKQRTLTACLHFPLSFSLSLEEKERKKNQGKSGIGRPGIHFSSPIPWRLSHTLSGFFFLIPSSSSLKKEGIGRRKGSPGPCLYLQ